MIIKNQTKKNIFSDISLWVLLFSNIITIFFAIKEGWNLSTIMWIYWFQSITIGFFNFIRILQLKEFSTENFKINNQLVKPTKGIKFLIAFFFLFHYGFFHLGYLIFLIINLFNKSFGTLNALDFKHILFTAVLFFITHLFSYIYNKPNDTKKQNIGTLMFYPYARIIPMHLTIILGSIYSMALLPFFLTLKTFSDIIMHIVEHQFIRKGEESEAQLNPAIIKD